VKYEPLSPRRGDFAIITSLMVKTGVLDHDIAFDEYVDTRFAEGSATQTPWKYEAGSGRAE
jgi:NitT/TauT family transport system substrate-binding protein